MPVSDIRNITHEELQGIDIICQLAAISNDPMGELDEKITMDINLSGTIKLAENAKKAGVKRFIFLSTIHVYSSNLIGTFSENSIPKNLKENPKIACVIGLNTEPERLVDIRKNRMNSLKETDNTNYTNLDDIKAVSYTHLTLPTKRIV